MTFVQKTRAFNVDEIDTLWPHAGKNIFIPYNCAINYHPQIVMSEYKKYPKFVSAANLHALF